MKRLMYFHENNIHMVFGVTAGGRLCLLHCSALPCHELTIDEKDGTFFNASEIHVSGGNQDDHHGAKHTGNSLSNTLLYKEHSDKRNAFGRMLEFVLTNRELSVRLHYQFFDGTATVRCWTTVTNICDHPVGLEYVSSFALTGTNKEGNLNANDKMLVMLPHNAWCREINWKSYSLNNLGLDMINTFSTKRITAHNSGTWSSKEYLPMGCFINKQVQSGLMWQIEHNGSWQWEISDIRNYLYLKISGPTENENHWWKNLTPGESFRSVAVAIAVSDGGFEGALREMTIYRRQISAKNSADSFLPVIFNDYMNCLNADPTTEKLIPVIDAAAQVGAEYFCIDAGWYADGQWWDTVGEWKPCSWRFPNGIEQVLNHIKSKQMIPGMWLEIEVIGINSPNASWFDDNCYFMRHGKKVIDHGRYQLDFRNEKVIGFATSIIERLVEEYGVGYIKMDYNIDAGIGTQMEADSFGDGLLEHNRAYLIWIKAMTDRYPHLIIENCSSGGMRMDYAMLSVHPIQSITDQTDYLKMAPIAAAASTAVLPEQAAIWSYPLADAGNDAVVFNMVNAMLCRIHLSGQVMNLDDERLGLIKEGIKRYKEIRSEIRDFVPFYPLGLPDFNSDFVCVGYSTGKVAYVAVWSIDDNNERVIPLPDSFREARWLYPEKNDYTLFLKDNTVKVRLSRTKTAGIIQLY